MRRQKKISEAIGGVNMFNAPIKVLILEHYAEVIKKEPLFTEGAYELLKANTGTVIHKFDVNNPKDMELYKAKNSTENGGQVFYGKL